MMPTAAGTALKEPRAVHHVASRSRLGVAPPNTWSITQACCTKRLPGTVSGIQNFGGNAGGMLAYWLLMNERVSLPEEA
jgi:hypothetical protein